MFEFLFFIFCVVGTIFVVIATIIKSVVYIEEKDWCISARHKTCGGIKYNQTLRSSNVCKKCGEDNPEWDQVIARSSFIYGYKTKERK